MSKDKILLAQVGALGLLFILASRRFPR